LETIDLTNRYLDASEVIMLFYAKVNKFRAGWNNKNFRAHKTYTVV